MISKVYPLSTDPTSMQLYAQRHQQVAVVMVPLRSHATATSSRIASVLHTAYDHIHVELSVHLAIGGREPYTMIVHV